VVPIPEIRHQDRFSFLRNSGGIGVDSKIHQGAIVGGPTSCWGVCHPKNPDHVLHRSFGGHWLMTGKLAIPVMVQRLSLTFCQKGAYVNPIFLIVGWRTFDGAIRTRICPFLPYEIKNPKLP
jgi:hypothetical protein